MPALIVAVKGNIDDLTAKMKEGAVEIARVEGAAKSVTAAVAPMATTLQTAGTHVTGLKGAMESFDGILASVGIHMGPQIRGLGELGEAAKQGASGMGMVASAGLAIGVGMAAWQITRAVMDFFELDGAVAKAWTSMLGYGDAAKEAAGAQADAIQLAFEKTGKHAKTAGEALALMTDWLKDHNAEAARTNLGPLSEQLAKAEAAVSKLTAEQRKQIDAGLALGTSHEKIAKFTQTTVAIVDMYVARTVAATKATKDREQAEEARAAALKVWLDDEMKAQTAAFDLEVLLIHEGWKHRDADAAQRKTKLADVNTTVLAGLSEERAATAALQDFVRQSTLSTSDYQILKIRETADAEVRALKGSEEQNARTAQAIMDLADRKAAHIRATLDPLEENIQRIMAGLAPKAAPATPSGPVPDWYARPVNAGSPTYSGGLGPTAGGGGSTTPGGGLPYYQLPPGGFSHMAEGGPVSSGQSYMVGERGPELFTPDANGYISPTDQMANVRMRQVWETLRSAGISSDAAFTAINATDRNVDRLARLNETAIKNIHQSLPALIDQRASDIAIRDRMRAAERDMLPSVAPAAVGVGAGCGSVVNVYVNVTQPLGTPYELARVIKAALVDDARSLGRVL